MKPHPVSVLGVFLVACGGSEPSPVAAPTPAPTSASTSMPIEEARPAPVSPEPVAACTMTKSLSESCAPCVKSRCCSPPVAFTPSTAQALGCRMGCRKPLPAGMPVLEDSDRAAMIKTCLARCGELFEPSDEATRLDGCIAERCNPECLAGG
ncbi:hypothetical protein [Polyangium mundeleinium]|uniref:Secreted protein n=1 Tax=Polyangium mundeleinium TaxID=2995306 RepID=A0ABT5F795_9BACT|nr:hypothetical protein [Polyangium mundeleinium]MDC0749499.1 hypothetical protein [Polyangium mundeleinium]